MTRIERVKAAIQHVQPDRVPKGDLSIAPALINKILGTDYPSDLQHFERDVAIREKLNADVINIGEWPREKIGEDLYRSPYGTVVEDNGKSSHIIKPMLENIEDAYSYTAPKADNITGDLVRRYKKETDFYVFSQIGGPISMLNEAIPMEDYLVYCMTNTEEMKFLGEKVQEYELEKARIFLDSGTDAILIADDMAYNSGTFLPPKIMDEIVFPFYKNMIREIKKYRDVPVFLHTDGNINMVMDRIVACGFDGIQSIQPSAGMDIAQIKRDYGDRLCLWGNIDLDYVLTFGTTEEVRDAVRKTIEDANVGGGFILSSCNILVDVFPPEHLIAMYEAAEEGF